MIDLLGDLNWLAVLVAALAWYAYSGIYYAGPVMGNTWQRATGLSLPQGYRPPPSTFVITLVAYVVAAIATGLLVLALQITEVADAIELGVVLSVGYVLVHLVVASTYEQRSWNLVWINGLNAVIGISGMAVILALWQP